MRSTRVAGFRTTPGLHAVVNDHFQRAVQVRADFVVDADPVGAGLGERGDEIVGVIDHQVAVEGQAGCLANAGYHGRPDGDVGDEVAVHDVDVDGGAAAALGRGNLIGQVGKISGKDGGQQLNHDFRAELLAGTVYQAVRRETREQLRRKMAELSICAGRPRGRCRAGWIGWASGRRRSGKKISPVRRASGR